MNRKGKLPFDPKVFLWPLTMTSASAMASLVSPAVEAGHRCSRISLRFIRATYRAGNGYFRFRSHMARILVQHSSAALVS
jgi:hypothetical protein